MRFAFMDFETHYSKEYSLRRMDQPSYILDARFEAQLLSVAFDDDPAQAVEGPDIPAFLATLDPNEIILVSHNALFDASILSWRFGFVPKFICDTLSMSRTVNGGRLVSHSLGALCKAYNLPAKGGALQKVAGMSRLEIKAAGLWPEYVEYCVDDTLNCRRLFKILQPQIPDTELILHDMIIRCAVEPMLMLNEELLAQHAQNEREKKELLLANAMLLAADGGKAELMSNDRFAQLLRKLGVNPPLKRSKATNAIMWAFAKTDPMFNELLDHPDPRVQSVVQARLGLKSTIEETRAERMLNISRLEFPHHGTGLMPIPLIVGAAHTHRLGGGWKLNPQNWGRGSPIRKSVEAPEGYTLVAADSSQIEARMTGWYCGQYDLVDEFRRGIDVYSNFAGYIFHKEVSKLINAPLRFVGKTGILQLGYQSGWPKFQATVALLSRKEGMSIVLSDTEAQFVVSAYREKYARISGKWKILQDMIELLCGHTQGTYVDGPLTFSAGRITGPTGLWMDYANMRSSANEFGGREWSYEQGGYAHKIYGGKLLENIIQFLARLVVMDTAVRLKKPMAAYGARLVHTAHDELVYAVPDPCVEQAKHLLGLEMRRAPSWALDLPLACDVKSGHNYGEVK